MSGKDMGTTPLNYICGREFMEPCTKVNRPDEIHLEILGLSSETHEQAWTCSTLRFLGCYCPTRIAFSSMTAPRK